MNDRFRSAADSSALPFADRHDAGIELAASLREYHGRHDVVVLALPRGGVPVGFEVARILDAPLDVFVVRKLGMPGDPEFAIGAIASGGVRVLREEAIRAHHIPSAAIEAVAQQELAELARREHDYRQGRPLTPLHGRTVILVDDGLATGSSMRAAVEAVRVYQPARVIVAVPLGAVGLRGTRGIHGRDRLCSQARIVLGGRPVLQGFFANQRRGSPRAADTARG